jgi:glucosyl-3-phosphoglycerate phosphatase
MGRLYLVRHGVPDAPAGSLLGWSDPLPRAEGLESFERLAREWPMMPSRMISSDLRRARDCGAVLSAAWGVPLETDPRLREMNFGDWDNLIAIEAERLWPAEFARWMANWQVERVPDGESFADVRRRVAEWLVDLRQNTGMGDTVIVISHAGTIRAIRSCITSTPPADLFREHVPHGAPLGPYEIESSSAQVGGT